MLDQQTWEFINSFAPWLSALGTIGAVITSLYLASRTDKIKLRIQARVMVLVTQNSRSGQRPEYLDVTVTNVRKREARVTAIGWETGLFKKNYYYWMIPRNDLSSDIPIVLKDGQKAQYMMPMSNFERRLGDIGKLDIAGLMARPKAFFIRVTVATSTGGYFKSRVSKDLRTRFLKMAKEAKG